MTIVVTVKQVFGRSGLCFSFEHQGAEAYCFVDVVNHGHFRLLGGEQIELEGQWAVAPTVFEAFHVRHVLERRLAPPPGQGAAPTAPPGAALI